MPDVVIVGGGISGLALAWEIHSRRPGASVAVLEGSSRPGGTAKTEHQAGFLLEAGPNGFLDNRHSTVELCRHVGLSDDLHAANAAANHRFVFLGDHLREVPSSPNQFLTSSLLSLRGRLRVLAERFIRPRRDGHDESICEFATRRLGKEAAEVLVDSLVTGIYAGDYEKLSLRSCFPRLMELEERFGGLLKGQIALARERRRQAKEAGAAPPTAGMMGGTLLAPRSGMGQLAERLAQKLHPNVFLHAPVRGIERTRDARWLLLGDGRTRWLADRVVLACPAHQQAIILQGLDEKLAREVGEIPYAGCAVCSVGFSNDQLPREPNGFGYVAPERLGRPVLGVQWTSSIFENQAPAGHHQFRAILGGWRRPDVVGWKDQDIIAAVLDDLRATMGIDGKPVFSWVHRWSKAIPQYHVGHAARLARIDAMVAKHPGLTLAGNAYRGVALNDCVAEAARLADAILRDVPNSTVASEAK